MAQGFENLRRGMQEMMHTAVNDAARELADKLNRFEPELKMTPTQLSSGPQDAKVSVSGSAVLAKEKKDLIKQTIDQAIEKTFRR